MITSKTLSAERLEEIKKFKNKTMDDCPVMSEEQLNSLHPLHSEYFDIVPKKHSVTFKMDLDLFEAFKATGKGYQNRINKALRQFVSEGRLATI